MASYQHQNESSSLLPTIASSHGSESESSSSSSSSSSSDKFEFERKGSFSKMKKVVHNDPGLTKEYENNENFQKLLGSTTYLRNSFAASSSSTTTTRKSQFVGFHGQNQNQNHQNQNNQNDQNNTIGFHGPNTKQRPITEMHSKISRHSTLYLKKIKTNFFGDAKSLAEGTIPQSIVLAIIIGIVCGIACYVYYSVLFFGLDYLWNVLPEEHIVPSKSWSPGYYWLWIPIVNLVMSLCVGLTVVYMGEPGDLPYTISRVHCEAYIPMNHVLPMVFASIFSILGELGYYFLLFICFEKKFDRVLALTICISLFIRFFIYLFRFRQRTITITITIPIALHCILLVFIP